MSPVPVLRISGLTAVVAACALVLASWRLRPAPRDDRGITVSLRPRLEPIAAPVPTRAPPPPTIRLPEPPKPARCCSCAMEANRRQARLRQHVIEARFLGVIGRVDDDGTPTTRRCRRGRRIWASVRFALTGDNPWPAHSDVTPERLSRMRMALPCPELSRAAYAKMFEPGGTGEADEDGRGTAPVLMRGATYRLRVVDEIGLSGETDETTELVWTLLAVDPA